MENFFTRYKNPLVLMLVLFIQVVGLATQVKRAESNKSAGGGGGPRLIRVWTVTIITPFEKAFSGTGHFFRSTWRNYIDLHDARKENRELQEQLSRMKLEQVRLQEDAQQAKRLQVLMDFKERYIGQTVAAQVIGTSGSDLSRLIYIDKGSRSGLKQDMPVITPDGIVGKIKEVFPFTSQVLLVNDHDSGAGVVMQNSRLQGILRGNPQGQLIVTGVMSDEKIETGERIVTSGGDRIYPKGVPVGTVVNSAPDAENDPFLKITVKPAANLEKLEEVLVVTRMAEATPSVAEGSGPQRAADILSQRLPSAQLQPPAAAGQTPGASPAPTPAGRIAPTGPATGDKKPATAGASPSAAKKTIVGAAPSTEKKAAGAAPSAENKTAGASPGPSGVTQKKSIVGAASASPTATPGATTTTPGTKKLPADQKKAQGTGTAAPAEAKGVAGASPTATPGTITATPGTKKPPTDQKKAQGTGAAAPAGTPSGTRTPAASAPGTKKSAPVTGTPVTGGTGATQKAKAPAKPKPTASPVSGEPQAKPAETPGPRNPESRSQPTPPPSGERPPR